MRAPRHRAETPEQRLRPQGASRPARHARGTALAVLIATGAVAGTGMTAPAGAAPVFVSAPGETSQGAIGVSGESRASAPMALSEPVPGRSLSGLSVTSSDSTIAAVSVNGGTPSGASHDFTIELEGVRSGGPITITITATSNGIGGVLTAQHTVTDVSIIPIAPVLTASASGADGISVSWPASSDTGVAGYEVRYAAGESVDGATWAPISAGSATLTGLSAGERYAVQLCAKHSAEHGCDIYAVLVSPPYSEVEHVDL